MTWSRRPSYSCLHWALKSASFGAGWPLAGLGAVFFLFATHAVNSGGSRDLRLRRAWRPAAAPCAEIAAIFIQWSKVSVLMISSSTLATALPGTLSPHALRASAGTARTQSAAGPGRACGG